MADANQAPKIPWWVSYWMGPTTTRSSLQREACWFFLMAAASLGVGTLSLFWQPPWGGVIVRPVALVLFPVVFTLAGVSQLAAVRWIDRHQAWDRITTSEEREACRENDFLWTRSLPLGLLFLAVGGAAGAVVAWFWGNVVSMQVGTAFGAIGGFVLGIAVAGFREGVRSGVGRSAQVTSQDTEQIAPADGGRDSGSS